MTGEGRGLVPTNPEMPGGPLNAMAVVSTQQNLNAFVLFMTRSNFYANFPRAYDFGLHSKLAVIAQHFNAGFWKKELSHFL